MNADFEQARQRFEQGLHALESGALEAAQAHFTASLGHLPGRPSTMLNLAVVHLRRGQPGPALPLLDEVLTREPANADAHGHRGAALAALGRAEEALAAYDRVLALVPGSPAAQFQRAALLNALGRHEAALAALDALDAALAHAGDAADAADARFQRGLTLQALGRPDEALGIYDRLLAQDGTLAPVWTQRGGILKDMGRHADAAEAFRRALAHGGDVELNRFFLASVEGAVGAPHGAEAAVPRAAPRAYVEGLFDGYAEDFDRHLRDRLGYRVPELLCALLPAGRRYAAALDLGCGTGLMAPLLRGRCEVIDGADLSSRMLAQARAGGHYRELHHADLTELMRTTPQRYALVTAADVLVYVGALDAVFEGAARVLEPGGHFLFSVERADPGHEMQLRPSSRYAYAEAYLRRLAASHGFELQRADAAVLRHDQGRPIEGLCLLLARAGAERAEPAEPAERGAGGAGGAGGAAGAADARPGA